MSWRDLVLVTNLETRNDLNGLLGEAHGRVKKGTQDREGVTILSTQEQVWVKRCKLELLRDDAMLEAAVEAHGLTHAERARGRKLMGWARMERKDIVAEWQQRQKCGYHAAM